MKFLCPSCKAKYQIADEKVIGRSVRMKCRQCGHLIEIQESVVGASTGLASPSIASPSQLGAALLGPSESGELRPGQVGTKLRQFGAGASAKREAAMGQPATALTAKPGSASVARSAANKPLAPTGSRITVKALAKSGAVAPPARTRPEPRAASKFGAGAPLGSRPGGVSPSPLSPPVKSDDATETAVGAGETTSKKIQSGAATSSLVGTIDVLASAAATSRHSGEALAEAFSSAVEASSNTVGEQYLGDEWYVGVDDSPVGPIPLSELRVRATQGQVTIDSLVWRDGFEDWKPLRSFPELLAVVEEALSSIQANQSLLVTPKVNATNSAEATAAPIAPAGANLLVNGSTGIAVPQPVSAPVFVPAVSPQLSAEEIAAATGKPLHKGPKAAWVAVAGALALGLAIGFVFFKQAPAAPEIKYVEVERSSPVPASAAPSVSAQPEDAPVVASADQIKGSPRKVTANEVKPTAENAANATQQSGGLKGLSGLRAPGTQHGPSESGATQAASGGQTLDSATLQKNVSRYTPSVRRSCWQPALDSRAPDAPTVARVSVKIDIAPSGNVSGVSSSGDPRGYRGLANCIESRVRNWTFPPSSGPTTVNVPFVFAAQ
jgi:predicted Zn finger-like uncharacterized protein